MEAQSKGHITEADISERKCFEPGRKDAGHQKFGSSQAEQAIKAALLETDGSLLSASFSDSTPIVGEQSC